MLDKNNYDTCNFLRYTKGDLKNFCVTRIKKFFGNYGIIEIDYVGKKRWIIKKLSTLR